MKKVYLSVIAAFLAAGSFGQLPDRWASIEHSLYTGPEIQSHTTLSDADRAGGDILWSDDFTTPANWVWNGPAGATDPLVNGWSIGTTCNGWFFTGDMSTTGNFARFNNGDPTDDVPPVVDEGPHYFTYLGVIPDLTGICAPQLEFEQFGARFITHQFVEISLDGGGVWTEVGNNDDIEPLTAAGGSIYPEPMTMRYNLTTYIAADPSAIQFRIGWDGAMNGATMNYIDYGWFVDNVRIVEGYGYDQENNGGYFVSGAQFLEYYLVPEEQLTPIEFSSETTNQGCQIHTGLGGDYNVDFGAGSVYTGSSASADLAIGATDSVVSTTTFTPADGEGTYDITYNFSGTNPEDYTANDVFTDAFDVTDYWYSRSNGVKGGQLEQVGGNDGQQLLSGNVMEIMADAFIGAIRIEIGDDDNGVAVDGDPSDVDGLVFGAVYLIDASTGDVLDSWQTDDYIITSADISDDITLAFDQSIEVFAGDVIWAAAGHYGDPEVDFGYAQATWTGTVWVMPADGIIYNLTDPGAMMIDLDMRDYTKIDEQAGSFTIGQNIPNPFNGSSVINYTITAPAEVSVKFTDVAGKVVMNVNPGVQQAGDHTINVDAANFAEGTYFYTFTIGGKTTTKRMVVAAK